jgi:hypothetical protein
MLREQPFNYDTTRISNLPTAENFRRNENLGRRKCRYFKLNFGTDMKDEIVLYQLDKLAEHIEVKVKSETVWLNRQQIATLFDRDVKTIGKHIANVL